MCGGFSFGSRRLTIRGGEWDAEMREKRIRSEVSGYRGFAEYRRERERGREGGRERENGDRDDRWRMGLNGVRVGIRRTIRNSE